MRSATYRPTILTILLLGGGASAQTPHFEAGGSSGSNLGMSVAAIGDVDGDGLADYAAGGPLASNMRGLVRVYSGLDGTLLAEFSGSTSGEQFGTRSHPADE